MLLNLSLAHNWLTICTVCLLSMGSPICRKDAAVVDSKQYDRAYSPRETEIEMFTEV